MSLPYRPPDLQEIALELPDAGIQIDTWVSYTFASDFLTPTDGWDFTLGGYQYTDAVKAALAIGARVSLSIDGHTQASGYIDEISYSYGRDGGTEITVSGRDTLAPAVDACADPSMRVPRDTTLEQFLSKLFAPYGLDQFAIDNEGNRNVITGQVKGTPTTKKKGKPIASFQLHQLRPYVGEGVFRFAARVTQRMGMWIWPTAQGNTLIVGLPDFDSEPMGTLRRTFDTSSAQNNILAASPVRFSATDQPDVVVAEGFGYGGEWGHSMVRAYAVNPMTGVDDQGFDLPEVTAALKQYVDGGAVRVSPPPVKQRLFKREKMHQPMPVRVLYLHDQDAHTSEELQRFVRRELALRMGRAVEATYTVEGHAINGAPYCVDTVLHVVDEVAGLDEPMWVAARTFTKSRGGGTLTRLRLIRPHSLEF